MIEDDLADLMSEPAGVGRGKNNANWRGGRFVDKFGYVHINLGLGHPMADSNGRIREHRLVMSQAVGRPLTRAEVVHHINGDRQDNRIENLKLFSTHAEHVSFERQELHRLRDENERLRELLGDL